MSSDLETHWLDGDDINRDYFVRNIYKYTGSHNSTVKTVYHAEPYGDYVRGYWYTAYRPLTDPQVKTLKEESVKAKLRKAGGRAPPAKATPAYAAGPYGSDQGEGSYAPGFPYRTDGYAETRPIEGYSYPPQQGRQPLPQQQIQAQQQPPPQQQQQPPQHQQPQQSINPYPGYETGPPGRHDEGYPPYTTPINYKHVPGNNEDRRYVPRVTNTIDSGERENEDHIPTLEPAWGTSEPNFQPKSAYPRHGE